MRKLGIIILLLSLLLQSCTIGYLSLQNKINNQPCNSENLENKLKSDTITYSIKIDGRKYFRTRISAYSKEQMNKFKDDYTKATSKVLSEKHFEPFEVSDGTKPNLSINIMIAPHVGAVAVEYLTGLSFGLIPTWATREKQYIYEFENTITGETYKYWVDDKRFNHLIAFPFFWTLFLVDAPLDKYEEALSDFTENYKIMTKKHSIQP
jgi:hypothetical protein